MSFWSDCEPRRSDHPTLCSSSIACFADLGCLPCGALDFG
jgi:hypothetical protein